MGLGRASPLQLAARVFAPLSFIHFAIVELLDPRLLRGARSASHRIRSASTLHGLRRGWHSKAHITLASDQARGAPSDRSAHLR
jgi:hypothetical protein